MKDLIKRRIQDSISTKSNMLENEQLLNKVEELANEIAKCIRAGHKLVICGNGGSASDALHFVG